MTPIAKELIFDIEEMHVIGVYCQKCGTGILFDAKTDVRAPEQCPSCPEKMEFEGEVIRQYIKFYQRMAESKRKFHFRVSVPV